MMRPKCLGFSVLKQKMTLPANTWRSLAYQSEGTVPCEHAKYLTFNPLNKENTEIQSLV